MKSFYKYYKIEYKHQDGYEESMYVPLHPDFSGKELKKELKDIILNSIHKFQSGSKGGHGFFTAECTKVSRPSNENILEKIEWQRNSIRRALQFIKEYEEQLRIEYEEFESIFIK